MAKEKKEKEKPCEICLHAHREELEKSAIETGNPAGVCNRWQINYTQFMRHMRLHLTAEHIRRHYIQADRKVLETIVDLINKQVSLGQVVENLMEQAKSAGKLSDAARFAMSASIILDKGRLAAETLGKITGELSQDKSDGNNITIVIPQSIANSQPMAIPTGVCIDVQKVLNT